MRIPKPVMMVLFPAFLCYYAVAADAALQGHRAAGRPSVGAALARLVPRLPDAVTETVHRTVADLRQTVLASALMTDTRPSAAQERRDHVALWAELESGLSAVAAPERERERPDYPVLEPGQD